MDTSEKNTSNIGIQKSQKSLVEFDFIKDKPHLIYLIKKVEKLAGAVHLITSYLLPHEPLRSELRNQCLLLLKNIISFEKKSVVEVSLESTVAECIALLDIGRSSLMISPMNAELLKSEFINLLPVLNGLYVREREQVSFDQEAFLVPPVEFALPIDDLVSKGHLIKDNDRYSVSNKQIKSTPKKKTVFGLKDTVDSTRDKLIIDVIKAKGEVGIKDISVFIKGVSAKTIQRDLLRLVNKGILKKSGKRRWSRYSFS